MQGTVAFALVALGLLAGCGARRTTVTDERVTIVVDNQNFYDATVYLRWYSDRRRLGSVTGYTKREFDAQWQGPEVQVEVDLLAGGTYRGDRISVSPGETLEVELPPNLDRLRVRTSGL
jgi:hypothetical protein